MSLLNASGVAVGRRTGRCAATDEPIAPGADVVTTLIEPDDPAEPMIREDFLLSAWEDGARPASDRQVFAFWRTTQPDAQAPTSRSLLGTDELLELFGRTESESSDAEDERRVTFRYVLALLLIRRRVLSVVGQARSGEGVELSVKVRGRPDETFAVVDPQLSDEELERETQAVIDMFSPEEDGADGPDQPAADAPASNAEASSAAAKPGATP